MFFVKRVVIAQHERGLLLKNRSVVKILQPGIYGFFDPLSRMQIEKYDVTQAEFNHVLQDVLIEERRDLLEQHFQLVELNQYQVGLVYKNGKLRDVLVPGSRQLYWQGPVRVRVEIQDISEDFAVDKALTGLLAHARMDSMPRELINYVAISEVADNHVGFLMVGGKLACSLQPGLHVFWKFNRNVKVEQVDLRLQAMEVQGQEILSKDRVSLRVNLAAQFRIVDAIKARNQLVNLHDTVYRELQFALRIAIGSRSLDALLANKDELDHSIFHPLKEKLLTYGVDLCSVGIKDIILPGDMKEILNQVVEAEKMAQANVIKRREETAATRSLLNTAKLMEDNPTLLRLKEMEVLEKVAEKVDKLTVFGGLDAVLRDTVQINVKGD